MGVTAEDLTRIDAAEVPATLVAAATYAVTVDLAGTIVRTSFNDLEAAEIYRDRYRHMLSERPVQRKAYAVAHCPDEIYFWLEGGAAYRWDRSGLKPHAIAFFADAMVTTGIFTSTDDLIAIHASVVCDERAAAAILGCSTAGKTTTAVACARRGLSVLSDEHCVVTSGNVRAFPRALNLRCDSIRLLAGDPAPPSPLDRWLETHGRCSGNDHPFDELFGAPLPPAPKPLRVVFALVGTAPHPSIQQISAAAMLDRAKSGVRMKPQGFKALQALFALLQGIECYDLVKGTPDETARIIARVLSASSREMSSVA